VTAIYKDTPPTPEGPMVRPGEYTVKLTVNGRPSTRTLTVAMDPRVKAGPAAIARMHEISMRNYRGILKIRETQAAIEALRKGKPAPELDQKLAALYGQSVGGRGGRRAGGGGEVDLARVASAMPRLRLFVQRDCATA